MSFNGPFALARREGKRHGCPIVVTVPLPVVYEVKAGSTPARWLRLGNCEVSMLRGIDVTDMPTGA